jgi:hypothetical protein
VCPQYQNLIIDGDEIMNIRDTFVQKRYLKTRINPVGHDTVSVWLDITLSRTWLNAPAELALVKTMVDGFVGSYIERKMTLKRIYHILSVAFTPI